MSVEAGRIFFTIGAETDEVDRKVSDSFRELIKQAVEVTIAFTAIKKGVEIVSDVLRDSVKAASDADQGIAELAAALQRAGERDAMGAAGAFEEFAHSLQMTTGISDAATISAAKIGASMGITGHQLEDTAKAAADLSAVLGVDMSTAMRQIAFSAESGHSAIRGLHIEFDDGASKAQNLERVLETLNSHFAGAASAAVQTYEGRVKIMHAAWEDAEKELGRAFTQNQMVNAVLQVASQEVEKLAAWIRANRETMSQWVSSGWSYIVTAAGAFITVMEYAGKAMEVFKAAGNIVIIGVIELFDLLLAGVEKTLDGLGALSSVIPGMHGVSDSIRNAADGVHGFREGVQGVRDVFIGSVADSVQGWRDIDAAAQAARETVAGIDQNVRQVASTITTTLPAAAQTVNAAIKDSFDFGGVITQDLIDVGKDLSKLVDRELTEEIKKQEEERKHAFLSTATALSGAFDRMTSDLASGRATVAKALAGMLSDLVGMVKKAIMAYALEAAAAQFAKGSIAGPIGLALGAVAAAATLSAIQGLISRLPGAAHGALVEGGTPGVDSVPMLLEPGEMVLPVTLTRALLSVAGHGGASQGMASGGMVQGSAVGGPALMIGSLQLLQTSEINQEQIDRLLISISDRASVMHKRGLFLPSAALAT